MIITKIFESRYLITRYFKSYNYIPKALKILLILIYLQYIKTKVWIEKKNQNIY
jgi:hypothetical protein